MKKILVVVLFILAFASLLIGADVPDAAACCVTPTGTVTKPTATVEKPTATEEATATYTPTEEQPTATAEATATATATSEATATATYTAEATATATVELLDWEKWKPTKLPTYMPTKTPAGVGDPTATPTTIQPPDAKNHNVVLPLTGEDSQHGLAFFMELLKWGAFRTMLAIIGGMLFVFGLAEAFEKRKK